VKAVAAGVVLSVLQALAAGGSAVDTQVRILGLETTVDGRLRIRHSVPPDHYFILLSGSSASGVRTAVDMQAVGASAGVFEVPLSRAGAAFFQVRAVPSSAPLDWDGDRIDDVYELGRRPLLDPLNPQDGGSDPDGDGLTSFEEYLRGTDPATANALVTEFRSSPAAGESDVAVTRETIVEFSEALAASVVASTNTVYAEFGGRRLLSRVEISTDRRKVSLFYLENLPGSARVRVTVDGESLVDMRGRKIDADRDGQEGGVGTFHFDTVNLTPAPGTVVVGQVFASELGVGANGAAVNRPLAGVTVTVDGREQDLRAVTDADGRFRLSPAPAGTFFVHIDGRTAPGSSWPGGAYYPFVGKAWEAVAGRTNLAGGDGVVYLPLVSAGALQPVSPTAATAIGFPPDVLDRNPELEGVEIVVPANALFNDAGVRGGRVGIAPVSRDRLPSPLPPGLDLPLVITVQTDGPQNFDQPVPVRFPNTPDPTTGQTLAPGAKSALWSFNHDTGRWEIVGPMTVSADGRFVDTDPGVGLRQPGWHGQRPGTSGNGPPGPPPPDFCDKVVESALASFYGCAGGKALAGALQAAGGLTIDAVGSTLPGEGVVAMIAGSAGTYVVRQGTFGSPEDAITEAIDYERICCSCLASSGIGGSAGCGGKISGLSEPGLASGAALQMTLAPLPAILARAGGPKDAKVAAVVARLEALTGTWVETATRHLALTAQGRALAGSATRDTDVTPAVLEQLRGIDAEIRGLLGSVRPAAYYGELLAAMQKAEGELMQLLGMTGSGPARYLLENLTRGTVQLRGRTDSNGALGDLILQPNQNYRLTRLDEATLAVGVSEFASGATGTRTLIPRGIWLTGGRTPTDADADGLNDLAERVLGTRPDLADTDGDGLTDAAEVIAGSDPLGDLVQVTGVIGSADTSGNAMDVCVLGDLAVVADGTAGVALFNVSRSQQPVLVAQVNTPGSAVAVACASGVVYVADGASGMTMIDTLRTEGPAVVRTVGLGSAATAVAEHNGWVVVGLADGRVMLLDPETGRLDAQRDLGTAISDLSVDEFGRLWAVTRDRLFALDVERAGGIVRVDGSTPLSFFPEGITGRRRLFLAEGRAYVTSYPGFEVVDVTNPSNPTRLGPAVDAGPNSFKQIVGLSRTLGAAAVGINPRADGTHDVWLYDLSAPSQTTNFLAILPTPGIGHAVAVHRGRVLVADGDSGLQVVNPLAADTGRRAPSVTWSAMPEEVEEGTVVPLVVRADDDVLVARVEFFVNGTAFADDGAYPFGVGYVVPALTEERTTFRIRARATDTGGNSAWTEERTLRILPDRTSPEVVRVTPAENGIVGATEVIRVLFSEPIDEVSMAGALRLWRLPAGLVVTGAEAPPGVPVSGVVTVSGNVATLRVSGSLPEGRYLAQLDGGVRDRAGNPRWWRGSDGNSWRSRSSTRMPMAFPMTSKRPWGSVR
jgi:hypothetical protein